MAIAAVVADRIVGVGGLLRLLRLVILLLIIFLSLLLRLFLKVEKNNIQ
jgi:hypothetical protein